MKNDKRTCGIVTFHSAHNYGSVLQSYAMVKTMCRLGLDAELIDFRHPHTTDMYEWRLWTRYKNWRWNVKDFFLRGLCGIGKKREKVFKDFIDRQLPKSARVSSRTDIDAKKYDVLVCGSDQIWNKVSTGENDPIYFLDFGDTRRKFSYAASAGSSPFPEKDYAKYKTYLSHLQSIGVREEWLRNYLEHEFGLQAEVNPDPTLLLDKEEWAAIEVPYAGLPAKYLLVYTLAKATLTLAFAQRMAEKLGLPVVQICNSREWKGKAKPGADYNLMDASPQQFLWLFHHAEFVVSNTFHGNMFSVIFRKDFVHYDVNGNDSRITTLHTAIGLHRSRMIKHPEEMESSHIDYARVEENIKAYAHKGLAFIKKNIAENEA